MKSKSFLFTVYLCLSFACSSYAQQQNLSLTLQQCVDLALKNNVDVVMAKARAQEALGQQTVIDADLLPQIDAVASQERTWWENVGALGFPGFGSLGPFNTFNADIMVSQRILDLSALAHARAGKFKSESAAFNGQLADQQVTLAAGFAYIQVLQYEDELASSDTDVQLAQHFLSLSQHQMDVGLASKLDVARNRTQLAQNQARQEQLHLQVIKAQLELKRLVKIPLSQSIELTDTLSNASHHYLEMNDAIAHAQENRMDIRAAQADSQYSRTELKASQYEHLPTVSVSGEYGEMGNTPQGATHAANAMVSISLPIWEGNRTAGDVKAKRALNEEQEAKTDDLHWKIEEDVRLSLETLQSSYTQLLAEKKVEEYAQDELNLAQDRFASGLGDNIQLINAQAALADSRDKYVQALAQYNQAQLNYFGALGEPELFSLSKGQVS